MGFVTAIGSLSNSLTCVSLLVPLQLGPPWGEVPLQMLEQSPNLTFHRDLPQTGGRQGTPVSGRRQWDAAGMVAWEATL